MLFSDSVLDEPPSAAGVGGDGGSATGGRGFFKLVSRSKWLRRLRANSTTASGTSRVELLAKERNEMAFAFPCNVKRSRTGAHHVAMTYVGEINTDDLERAAVQLRLAAHVRDEQSVDDCAPMVLEREEILMRNHLGATRELRLQAAANPAFIRDCSQLLA